MQKCSADNALHHFIITDLEEKTEEEMGDWCGDALDNEVIKRAC